MNVLMLYIVPLGGTTYTVYCRDKANNLVLFDITAEDKAELESWLDSGIHGGTFTLSNSERTVVLKPDKDENRLYYSVEGSLLKPYACRLARPQVAYT